MAGMGVPPRQVVGAGKVLKPIAIEIISQSDTAIECKILARWNDSKRTRIMRSDITKIGMIRERIAVVELTEDAYYKLTGAKNENTRTN